jgi:hypothetical protein
MIRAEPSLAQLCLYRAPTYPDFHAWAYQTEPVPCQVQPYGAGPRRSESCKAMSGAARPDPTSHRRERSLSRLVRPSHAQPRAAKPYHATKLSAPRTASTNHGPPGPAQASPDKSLPHNARPSHTSSSRVIQVTPRLAPPCPTEPGARPAHEVDRYLAAPGRTSPMSCLAGAYPAAPCRGGPRIIRAEPRQTMARRAATCRTR